MLEIFDYDFMIRALIVGSLCSLVSSVLGNFLVAGRNAFTFEMISHGALAGVGIGFYLHFSPSLMASIFSVLLSILLIFISRDKKKLNDAVAMVLLSGSMALALLFTHLAKDNPVSFHYFLFGSILTTSTEEMWRFGMIALAILTLLLLFWNRFVGTVFDHFSYRQFNTKLIYEILLMIMVGILISFSLKIIGGLLLGALLVIPVLTAQNVARNFLQSVCWSIVFSLIGMVGGIVSSFYLDIPSSSGIVLSLIFLFFLSNLIKKIA